MKRNRQQKFRIKIIQELHLKKKDQKILDDYSKNNYVKYKDIYMISKNYISFSVLIKRGPKFGVLIDALKNL